MKPGFAPRRHRSALWDAPLGDDRLSLYLKHRRQEDHSRELLLEIARETGEDLPVTKSRAAGDPVAMRGVPIAGTKGGLGGTILSTQPEAALMAKETHRERDG